MSCNDQSLVAVGIPCDVPNIDLGCILDAIIDPATNKPNYEPAPDQLPFAKAPNGLWVWTCENGWVLVESDRQLQCINLVTEAPTYTPSSSQPFMAMDAEKGILWFYTCADGWKFVQTQVCIPPTTGEPSWNPTQGFPYYAYDSNERELWFYVCGEGWRSIYQNELCRLQETDLTSLNNLCTVLKIPVTYNFEGQCFENKVSLQILANEIWTCLGIEIPDPLTYDCIPFHPEWGPSSPAPSYAGGAFVLDCEGTLWVWTCNGNQWVPVRNNFPVAPDYSPIDDEPAYPCEALQFFVKIGDSPDCQKYREITLNDLSLLIDKCATPNVHFTDPSATNGFGVCFVTGTTSDWEINPSSRMSFSVTNPTNTTALLEIDMRTNSDTAVDSISTEGLTLFAHYIGEEILPKVIQEGTGGTPISSNWAFTNIDTRDIRGTMAIPTEPINSGYAKETGFCKYVRILQPNETVNLYAMWFYRAFLISGNNLTLHGGFSTKVIVHKKAALI